MGNMSYCRFENTAADLRDCLEAIERNAINDLSSYEINGLESILRMAHELIEIEDEIIDAINILKQDDHV